MYRKYSVEEKIEIVECNNPITKVIIYYWVPFFSSTC